LAEIQIVGGYEVAAEVYASSEEAAVGRRAQVLAALNRRPQEDGAAELVGAAMEAAERLYDLAMCSPPESIAYRTNLRIAKNVARIAGSPLAKIGGDQ
jgi:hypothetical protein